MHWSNGLRAGWKYDEVGRNAIAAARLYLFDIDGTLLRGATAVHRDAFAHAFRQVCGVDLTLDGISASGRTDRWLFTEALRSIGYAEQAIQACMPDVFLAMQVYVDTHLSDLRSCVLPGVAELLRKLQGERCHLGLLTGNLSPIAYAKLRHAGLSDFFSTGGYGEESTTRADLVPVAVAAACDRFGLSFSFSETVVIGDTPLDVEAGRAHGTLNCGVATGFYSRDALVVAGADLVLESFADSARAASALLSLGLAPT